MIPENEICESNRIVDLDGKTLLDLVVSCNSSSTGMDILNTWKDDFLKRQIPFIIQSRDRMMKIKGTPKSMKYYTLWIEETIPLDINPGQPNKKEKVIFKL
jgi:hypothetical protein